jgi:hypothetical protein
MTDTNDTPPIDPIQPISFHEEMEIVLPRVRDVGHHVEGAPRRP